MWKDANLHINGVVDVKDLTCTSCHGDPVTKSPAPPLGTKGETLTTQLAVGAHSKHLGSSAWHKQVACEECHTVPVDTGHSNGIVDLAFGTLASTGGVKPNFDVNTATCSNAYCHGVTLQPAKVGGQTKQVPVWTQVDETFNACGASCHTNPPGGKHPQNNQCNLCHTAVVSSYDPATSQTVWADATLHINGVVDSNQYHALPNWVSPKFLANGAVNPSHHGSTFFVANQQKDDKNTACTSCHGADWSGGTVNVSCGNNGVGCHGANPAANNGGDWKSCNFCHGNANLNNPPGGVGNEKDSSSLAVGRHGPHLTSSATHVALTCDRCHTVPSAGDVSHVLGYVPSLDLSSAGHHGDVTFPPLPAVSYNTGLMTFSADAVLGSPVNERGTCTGACHSNGKGGAPVVTPYWAGGSWTAGSCGNCHAAKPTTGHHGEHLSGGNNVACTVCHPDAASASHVNGVRDVLAAITPTTPYVGNITATRPVSGGCTTSVRCSGTCHGENHSSYCW